MIKKNINSHYYIICGILITSLYNPLINARSRGEGYGAVSNNNNRSNNYNQPNNNRYNNSSLTTYSAQDIADAQSIFNTFQADINGLKGYGNFDPNGMTILVTPPIMNPQGNLSYQTITSAFTTWYQQGTFPYTMTNQQGGTISIPNYTVNSFKVAYDLYVAIAGQAAYTTSTGTAVAAIPPKSQNACTLFFNSLYTAYKNGLSKDGKTLNPAWLDTWLATNNVQNSIPAVTPPAA